MNVPYPPMTETEPVVGPVELNATVGLCGVNTIAEIDDHVLAI